MRVEGEVKVKIKGCDRKGIIAKLHKTMVGGIGSLVLIALIGGCMSLEERLASTDEKVRFEAEHELWSQAQTGQQKLNAIARLTDPALLLTIAQTCEGPIGMAAVTKMTPVDCQQVAIGARDVSVRRYAFEKLEGEIPIVSFYKSSQDPDLKLLAIKKLAEKKAIQSLKEIYSVEHSEKQKRVILENANDVSMYLQAYKNRGKDIDLGRWIIVKIPKDGLVNIPYTVDMMCRWRDISNQKVLAKLLRDKGNELSSDERKDFLARIHDVEILKELCTPPSTEAMREHVAILKSAEEMREKAKEKRKAAKNMAAIKGGKRINKFQLIEVVAKLRSEATELETKAETLNEIPWLYAGDDKIIWVVGNIADTTVRNEMLSGLLMGDTIVKLVGKMDANKITAKGLKPDVALEMVKGISDQEVLAKLSQGAKCISIRYAAISQLTDIAKLRDIRAKDPHQAIKKATVQRLKELGLSEADELIAFTQYDKVAFWLVKNINDKGDLKKIATTAKSKGVRLTAASRLDTSSLTTMATQELKSIGGSCPKGHLNIGGLYLGMDIIDAFAILAARFPEVKPTLEWGEDEKSPCAYENVHDNSSRYRILTASDNLTVKCINVVPSMTKKITGFDTGTFDELRNSVEKHFKFPLHSELFQTTDYNQMVGVVTTTDGETLHYFESEKESDKKYIKKITSILDGGTDVEFISGERGGLRLQYTCNAAKGKPLQNYNGGNRSGIGTSGSRSGSLTDFVSSGINMMRNNAESLKASANALDALSKGDIGGALQSGAEAMKKNVETLKDASKVLNSAGTMLEGANK